MALLECDLVMKGGVTSGTVYPKAIARLAQDYRFRSIGGTSAGAIAAAVAAAAEYRRQTDGSISGFDKLATLPVELSEAKTRGPMLLELFQPQRPTAALFRFLLGFIGQDRTKDGSRKESGPLAKAAKFLLIGRVFARALWHFFPHALLGIGIAVVLGACLNIRPESWIHWVSGVLFLLGGAAAGGAWGVWRAVLRVPANGFGLCRGFEPSASGAAEDDTHLTTWLHSTIQTTAGLDPAGPPLTFEALAAKGIQLRVMTSNLNYRQPHRLPFREGEAWAFFDPAEWRQYFPRSVLDYLENFPSDLAGVPSDTLQRIMQNQKLLPLPREDALPVLVAARLSLSFPLLLSAVPIYMLDPSKHRVDPARKCWFSDGGICSNFPLHFFDSPIPTRPTFGLNLQDAASELRDDDRVALPKTNLEGLERAWVPIREDDGPRTALQAFLLAIVDLLRNWRDNSVLRLPGYRDRVASIRLKPHEGGLNLNMPPKLITALAQHGERAADRLVLHFHPDHAAECAAQGIDTTWENHRWVRLLSSLAGLERLAGELDNFWNPAAPNYRDLLDPDVTANPPSYTKFTRAQRELALRYLSGTRDAIAHARAEVPDTSVATNTPRPPLHFRLTEES